MATSILATSYSELRLTLSPELAPMIETAIDPRFGFAVKTLVRACPVIEAIAQDIPTDWRNDTSMKSDVMLLWDDIAGPEVLKQLTIV